MAYDLEVRERDRLRRTTRWTRPVRRGHRGRATDESLLPAQPAPGGKPKEIRRAKNQEPRNIKQPEPRSVINRLVRSLIKKCAIRSNPYFNPEVECFVMLLVNVRRKIKGHILVSMGLLGQALVHPRKIFRAALIASAHSVIPMHNHPSGDSNPSEAGIRVTRDLVRAGQVLKIEVRDHVIVGRENHSSLRELGYLSFT